VFTSVDVGLGTGESPPAILDRETSAEGVGHYAAASYAYHLLGYGEAWRERITPHTALTYSAIWACVRIISQTLASIGWHVFERMERGAKRLSINDNIAWTLGMQANPEMSAFEWRQVMLKDALLWGNGYSEIERTNGGKVLWLWRIDPSRVCPERDENGRLYYRVQNQMGPDSFLDPSRMFHLRGMGPDGVVGYSVVEMARRSIELGLQEERFGSEFFKRGPMPGGILTSPTKLSDEQTNKLRESFQRVYGGMENAGRVVVLSGNMAFAPLTLPNNDAQFLESRTFQVNEICRWFGVPPHKLAELSKATFSNIEEQERAFVADCLLPWARRMESEADIKLYGSVTMGRRYTRLNLDALQRGNSQTQTDTVTKKVMGGLMTPNEGRAYFDLNPDPAGDVLITQGQMIPLERAIEEPEPPPPPPEPVEPEEEEESEDEEEDTEEMPENIRRPFLAMLEDTYGRLLRVEADKARRAANRGELSRWAEEHYNRKEEVPEVAAFLRPIIEAMALLARRKKDAEALAMKLARLHVAASLQDPSPTSLANGRCTEQAARHLNLIWESIHAED